MMARWLCTVTISAVLFGSGCCCFRAPCDPCGPPTCCFSLPLFHCFHPIAWDGCCNDCGPSPCESCGDNCGRCRDGLLGHCFLFGGLRGCLSCGRGCSEIYCDEWKSDPPDCCDPCDQCCGQFTGPHGYCCLGPFQRILACLDGYKYCPPPSCGPWRPIFGHCNPGPGRWCGDVGCSTCGGGPAHGADVYYDGSPSMTGAPVRASPGTPMQNVAPGSGAAPMPRTTPRSESTGIFDNENSVVPSVPTRAQPARPLPTGQQAPPFQTSNTQTSGSTPQRMTPAQLAAAKRAAQKRAYEAAGIQSTNYQP
jgi:hypothetical protein